MFELSAPAPFSMTWEFGASNGTGWAPQNYDGVSSSFTARMGQRRGIAGYVTVKLCADDKTNVRVSAAKSRASLYRNGGVTQGGNATTLITCGSSPTIADAGDAPAVPTPAPPTRAADIDTDFRQLATAPEGAAGKWATMGAARWINNEVGKYADPGQDGTAPFQLRDGVFNLVAQKKPTRVGNATLDWSLPMLTTGGPGKRTDANSLLLFQYGWILLDSASPRVQGFVPALWQLAADGRWPPEVDFFEDFDASGERIGRSITSHLPGSGNRFGNGVLYGDLGLDVTKRHTHLVHVTPTVTTTWINGVLVDERPTLIQEPSYLLLSMSGGMNGASIDPKAIEVAWPIYRFAVWKE